MWKHHTVTSALCGKIAHQMCVSQFIPFFAKRKRHFGGAFRIFMKKSQILCSKFGLYDFFFYFRHFQSSWIFDFYIWVLLVEKSTSFFCFFTLNGTFFTGAFSSFSQPQTFFKKTVPEFQKG